MRTWECTKCVVKEKEFDYDLHEFDVVKNNKTIATITPDSIQAMEVLVDYLNHGYCVSALEDGKGNAINI